MKRLLICDWGEFFLPDDCTDVALETHTEILRGKTYPKVAHEAKLIWDIGAGLGSSALYFARCYPDAMIHCFSGDETGDPGWECLVENTRRVRSRMTLHHRSAPKAGITAVATVTKIDVGGDEVQVLEGLGDTRHAVPVIYLSYYREIDRRKLDALLPEHDLVRGRVEQKHRGTHCYLHRSIRTVEDNLELP